MHEFEMPYEELDEQFFAQNQIEEAIFFEKADILMSSAMQYGFSELQYHRGLRNVSMLRDRQKESSIPDDKTNSYLFTQLISTSVNFRRMQQLIDKNNFIIGACDGSFAALTGHSYIQRAHFMVCTEDELIPAGGTSIMAVISEVGIMFDEGRYLRILPAAFRVLNQENHGATLDEAHIILTNQMMQSQSQALEEF